MENSKKATAQKRKPSSWTLGGFGVAAVLLFAACSGVDAGGPIDPVTLKPAVAAVMALDDEIAFEYMPNERIDDLEWDVEIEYDTRDVQAVFEHYDTLLKAAGFDQVDIEVDDADEVEAEYRNTTTGVWVELEVERDDGRVDVDMDIEDPRIYLPGDALPPYSLTEFLGFELSLYPGATARDIEWDFSFDHPDADGQAVFDHYDGVLQGLGWNQTDIDNDDDDEWEADYRQDGVHLELEVEDEGSDGVEVELELNKLRFYQSQN